MKKSFLFILFATLYSLLLTGQTPCPNLVTNSDFEAGNSVFTSALTLNSSCVLNTYVVSTNFNLKCQNFPSSGDHTTGTGKFLIVQGGTAVNVWATTVTVVPNTPYTFSFWLANVVTNTMTYAMLVNGINVNQFTATQATPTWTKYTFTGVCPAGVTSLPIAIRQITFGEAYAFGIDDISFTSCGCANSNSIRDSSITVCSRQPVNLTNLVANYGNIQTPLWFQGSASGAAVRNPVAVLPPVTTTYFLVGQSTLGCKDTAEVEVNIYCDTVFKGAVAPCGISPQFIKNLGKPSGTRANRTPVSVFPIGAIEHCGKFEIYYEDLILTNQGFDAGSGVGQDRRTTLCAVLNYVQSVFDFSKIPTGKYIRLHVSQSYSPTNPAPPGAAFLAKAGPFYNITQSHITYGYVRDYTISGTDPAVGQYHAELIVNFDMANGYTINWNNKTSLFNGNCQYDLYSVLLHEIGHTLGWISYAHRNINTLLPESLNGNNQYSGIDSLLQKGSVFFPTASLIPLLTGAPNAPIINSLITSSLTANIALVENDFWITPNAAPDNHPVYSGKCNYPDPFPEGSILSHLDDQIYTYTVRSRVSPGDIKDYVMGPFAATGMYKRAFQDIEVNTLGRLGYKINPAITDAKYINHPPYSRRMAGYSNFYTSSQATTITPVITYYHNNPLFSETVPPDYPPITNNGTNNVVIDLAAIQLTGSDLIDAENDPISVIPSSLVNIRGCGSGGNNHSQLVLSNNNQTITFTPRHNFYGRAQFGFRLFDGRDSGSYVIYTIDVLKGTNVNCAVGKNIVLNGDFEEGSEVKRLGVDEIIEGSQQLQYAYREGRLGGGINFGDSHPYNWDSNLWEPYGSGDCIKNSYIVCNGTTFNSESGSFSSTGGPVGGWLSIPLLQSNGERYNRLFGDFNYYNLCSDVKNCTQYILEFDYFATSGYVANGIVIPITVGFTNNASYLPGFAALTYSFIYNLTITNGTWQHVSVPFTNCGTAASILNLRQITLRPHFYMDNLSLIEVGLPPPLIVNITPTNPISTVTLTANVTNALCNTTYTWSGSNPSTQTITVAPIVATNYTVTVSDGCRSTTSNVTVNVPLDSCRCGTFSNMNFRPTQGGQTMFVNCGDTLTFACNTQFNPILGGVFTCLGANCPATPVNYELHKQGLPTIVFGNLPVPSFSLTLLASYFTTTGFYELTFTGQCGTQMCKTCKFYIKVLPAVNIDFGLTGYFPFTGNANDVSPSTTLVNCIPTSLTPIASNTAYNFNGTTSWIDATNNTRGVVDKVSVCAWVKTTEQTNGMWIAGQYDGPAQAKGYLLSIGGFPNFNIGLPSFSGRAIAGSTNYFNAISTSKKVNDGKWHCLIGTAGSGDWKIYIDGVLSGSATGATTPSIGGNTKSFTIGVHSDSQLGTFYYKGDMDEVRVYNRVLTQCEIDSLCSVNIFTGVNDASDKMQVRIYPNPNLGTFTIELQQPALSNISFRITDITGKLLQEKQTKAGTQIQTVEAANLPDGFYFLQIVSEGKIIAVEKFVKQ